MRHFKHFSPVITTCSLIALLSAGLMADKTVMPCQTSDSPYYRSAISFLQPGVASAQAGGMGDPEIHQCRRRVVGRRNLYYRQGSFHAFRTRNRFQAGRLFPFWRTGTDKRRFRRMAQSGMPELRDTRLRTQELCRFLE